MKDMLTDKDIARIGVEVAKVIEDNVDPRFDAIEGRLDRVENRLDRVEDRLTNVERKLDRTDGKVNALVNVLERKRAITEDEKSAVLS